MHNIATLKARGAEEQNRALGREWVVEEQHGRDAEWNTAATLGRIAPMTHDAATHKASESHKCWGRPVRIRNIYTGKVQRIWTKTLVKVRACPAVPPLPVIHEASSRERYYLVTTQRTCVRCYPDGGGCSRACEAEHPTSIEDRWMLVPTASAARYTSGPQRFAIDARGFVNCENALKAAAEATVAVFDSGNHDSWFPYVIPAGAVVSSRALCSGNIAELARKCEAEGAPFWENMS